MELLVAEANQKMRQGDFESAIQICEQILIQYPDSPRGHIAIGYCFKGLQRFTEAENHLQQAITMEENSPLPYHALCYVAYDKKDMEALLLFAEKAFSLEPDSYESLYLLGNAKIVNNERLKGIEYLLKAAQIQPDSPEVHMSLHSAYIKQNNWKKVQNEAKILYKLNPSAKNLFLVIFDFLKLKRINIKLFQFCAFSFGILITLLVAVVLLGSIAFLNPYFSIVLYLALIYLIRYGSKIRKKRSAIGYTIMTLSFIVLVLHFVVMVSYNFGPMR